MPEPVRMQALPCVVQRGPGTSARGDIAVGATSWGDVVVSIRHPDGQVAATLTVDQLDRFAHRLAAIVERINAADAGGTATVQ